MELSLVATIDAALVGMAASLVAESLELGGCMIGGMRNQPEDVAQVLGLPAAEVQAIGAGWLKARAAEQRARAQRQPSQS